MHLVSGTLGRELAFSLLFVELRWLEATLSTTERSAFSSDNASPVDGV